MEAIYASESIWLSTTLLAQLYDVEVSNTRPVLGLDGPLRVRGITDGHRGYLHWHRGQVFNA